MGGGIHLLSVTDLAGLIIGFPDQQIHLISFWAALSGGLAQFSITDLVIFSCSAP